MRLVETRADLVEAAGQLAIVREQEITRDFLDELHSERMAKASLGRREHDRVASVPTTVVDVWLRQGFPFWEASASDIVRRLEREDLHAFITTDRAV